MLRQPDHRYELAKAATDPSQLPDVRTSALAERIQTGSTNNMEVSYAYDLRQNEDHRPVIDAFFLSKTPMSVMASVLDIPESVLVTYSHLFLDMSVFRNKLELMSYASAYDGTAYGKELVRTAVQVGTDYLMWAYGSPSDIDTRVVVRRTMIDSYFRGMAHKGNSLTSPITKEAQKWWATAIKNAEILEKIDPRTSKQAVDELRIALEGKDDTVNPDQAPVPVSDILH